MTTITHPPETNGGVVTSWLPVITAWPSVPQCSTAIYSQVPGGTTQLALAFDPYYGISIDNRLTCLPPYATSWWDQTTQTPLQTVTSLGPFICPGLYTTASTSVINSLSTFVACCPTAYSFHSLDPSSKVGQCNSPLTLNQVFKYTSFDESATRWTSATTTISSPGSVFAVHVNGYIFAATTSTSSTSSASSIPTSLVSISSSLSLSPSQTVTTVSTGDRLSSGAKAGIGIGVALGILGLSCLFATLFLFRRQRQQRQISLNNESLSELPPTSKSPSAISSWQQAPVMTYKYNEEVYDLHELSSTPRTVT